MNWDPSSLACLSVFFLHSKAMLWRRIGGAQVLTSALAVNVTSRPLSKKTSCPYLELNLDSRASSPVSTLSVLSWLLSLFCVSFKYVELLKLTPGFWFADDKRQNTCLCWRGLVHFAGKGADFETVHIRGLQFVQEGVFSGWRVPYALITLSQLFSCFKWWEVCVKYTVLQK